MLAALDRKAVRNLLQMKGQFTAIALVIACGVAAFVMSLSTLSTLQRNQAEYYARYRFSDVFARVTRAPLTVVERITEIPGVSQVAPRIMSDVTLDLEDLAEPAIGRLISIPEHEPPGLNGLHLRSGRYIEPNQSGEVIVGEAFAEVHALRPGDSLRAVINGRERSLHIVGIAISPEYIFQIREGDVLPDDRRFGVLWMCRPTSLRRSICRERSTICACRSQRKPAFRRSFAALICCSNRTGVWGRTTATTRCLTNTFATRWKT